MPMDPVLKHYFDVLGIQPTTNKSIIKKAYTKKALQLHPDKQGKCGEEACKMIMHAWEVLREHRLSADDVQDESGGDAGGISCSEFDAVIRERDSLKDALKQHVDLISEQGLED